MDRIAPTRRPDQPVVMFQEWRHLSFLHWSVPPAMIQPLLPPGLTVDTHEGMAYVGLVPFTMRNIRPPGAPAIRHLSHFHETNVRTYVHYRGTEPGVWFFSLDAANPVAVMAARLLWKLPYFFAKMSLCGAGESLVYTSERRWPEPTQAVCRCRVTPMGDAHPAVPGTLEHFLVERYILYSASKGNLHRGRVHHQAYPLRTATLENLTETLTDAAGVTVSGLPPLVHYASVVKVEIFPLSFVI